MSGPGRRATIWIGGLVALGLMLWLLSAILLPFAAGFAIAYFLNPLCDRLERLGARRSLASVVALGAFILAIILIALVLVPLVEAQVIEMLGRIPRVVAAAREELNRTMGLLQERLSPDDYARLRDAVGSRLGDAFSLFGTILQGMLSSSLALVSLLSLIFVTPVVAFFLLRDWQRICTRVDGWLPRRHAATIRRQAALVDETLAGFIRGQAIVCLAMGSFYALALTLAGLEFGLVLGLLVGVLIFIPVLGGAIGAGLAVLIALGQFHSLGGVVLIAAIFAIGQALEGNLLTPKLVGERVHLHPVWVIFALLAFGDLFGLAGLLIAVPLAAVIGVLTRFALHRYLASALYDPEAVGPALPPAMAAPGEPPGEVGVAGHDEPIRL